ncbi:MAG TPA: hypothetical protein VM557_06495 [Thermoanaerobaculia bacterium]|nr:hypothetical protein [Thermoanaerobaculia bacterium]
MKNGLAAVTAMLLMAAAPAGAEDVIDVQRERVLIPVAFYGTVHGAHGSIWRMELAGYNDSELYVKVAPHGTCGIPCAPFPAGAKRSFTLDMAGPGYPGDGKFYYVDRPHHRSVHFELRARDISRETSTWGTEIPVVREHEVREGPVHLLDVPALDGFRLALRIYDLGPELNLSSQALVRVFDFSGGELLLELVVPLSTGGVSPKYVPAQARLEDFGSELGSFRGRVRFEITPVGNATRLWGFMSITHNETQHVTVVTPQ